VPAPDELLDTELSELPPSSPAGSASLSASPAPVVSSPDTATSMPSSFAVVAGVPELLAAAASWRDDGSPDAPDAAASPPAPIPSFFRVTYAATACCWM
jgi:hypothetical protein